MIVFVYISVLLESVLIKLTASALGEKMDLNGIKKIVSYSYVIVFITVIPFELLEYFAVIISIHIVYRGLVQLYGIKRIKAFFIVIATNLLISLVTIFIS